LTSPLLLYKVPRCGPESDKKVCSLGSRNFIWGLVKADLIITLPREWPTKLILVGRMLLVSK
jgi:hypothetical protein